MDIRDLIVGLMASLGKKEYSVQTLRALLEPFNVTDSALRTALSRLKAKNWLASQKRNSRAYYFFSKRGAFKRGTIAVSFKSLDWSGWDESFWGFLYSVPEEEKEQRYRIRKKLEVFHFALLYPGFWIRPKHPEDHFIAELSFILNSTLIMFKNQIPLTIKQIDSLWRLKELNEVYKKDVLFLTEELQNQNYPPIDAFVKKMEIGDRIVDHLFKDPLVPPQFLPKEWCGIELRKVFFNFDKVMTEYSKPFWEKIIAETQ